MTPLMKALLNRGTYVIMSCGVAGGFVKLIGVYNDYCDLTVLNKLTKFKLNPEKEKQ